MDLSALYKISYGLYVVTSNDGKRDNGLIVNTVMQVADSPAKVAVTINKQNYSHDVIKKTGVMNVNCLTTEAPFSVFENFGFKSGRDTDKFEGVSANRTENGLIIIPNNVGAVISLKVESYIDVGSHGMFICNITETKKISEKENMTYSYYHKNVKPAAKPTAKKGFVCKICGYVYEGETLPADYICPLCKHGAADFEPIEK